MDSFEIMINVWLGPKGGREGQIKGTKPAKDTSKRSGSYRSQMRSDKASLHWFRLQNESLSDISRSLYQVTRSELLQLPLPGLFLSEK